LDPLPPPQPGNTHASAIDEKAAMIRSSANLIDSDSLWHFAAKIGSPCDESHVPARLKYQVIGFDVKSSSSAICRCLRGPHVFLEMRSQQLAKIGGKRALPG
jgi:hypothetical protein